MSVARQEARDAIAEVIVIENGATHDSREVCGEFANLPIRWLLNDPPLPMTAWADRVFGVPRPDTDFFALLCDDDWWEPHHLRRSLERLRADVACTASWAGCVEYDVRRHIAAPRGHTIWMLTRYSPDIAALSLSMPQVLLANLLTTAFHISTVVARRSVIATVLPSLANGNPFDIDRHLACLLSTKGVTTYFPSPSVGVAAHAGRESLTLGRTKEAELWWRHTTAEIIGMAKHAGVDLASAIDGMLVHAADDMPTLLSHAYFDGCRQIGVELPVSPAFLRAARQLRIALALRRFLPPVVLKALGLSGWMARNLPVSMLA